MLENQYSVTLLAFKASLIVGKMHMFKVNHKFNIFLRIQQF